MIASVAVVPSAPALLRQCTGRVDVLGEVRDAAVDAARAACAEVARVVLVAATDRGPRHTMPPLGQRVGEHLLDRAAVASPMEVLLVPWDASVEECHRLGGETAGGGDGTASALVVVADGSARRSEKAPGHLDERAFGFDDDLVGALRRGEPAGLLGLDPALGADLLAHGRAPLQVAAAAMAASTVPDGGTPEPGVGRPVADAARWRCERCQVTDPLGVLHVVAVLRSTAASW